MSSIARQIKRGKRDSFGRPLPKRPFNNSKRTRGTQTQENNKNRFLEMKKRIHHIKKLCNIILDNNEEVNNKNWKQVIRKYDKEQLIYDDLEKKIIFNLLRIE